MTNTTEIYRKKVAQPPDEAAEGPRRGLLEPKNRSASVSIPSYETILTLNSSPRTSGRGSAEVPLSTRRLFMIFLLVLMPLQLSWAAIASYCQHETGAAAKHFGHHDHQHKATDGKETAPDPAKTGGGDPDCASCHAGCSSALPGEVTLPPMFSSSLDIADYWLHLTSPPFERLERPQ